MHRRRRDWVASSDESITDSARPARIRTKPGRTRQACIHAGVDGTRSERVRAAFAIMQESPVPGRSPGAAKVQPREAARYAPFPNSSDETSSAPLRQDMFPE